MEHAPPKRWLVILAFAIVYIIWGSTFLAIKFAVTEIPPMLTGAVRFALAGAGLALVAFAFGQGKYPRRLLLPTIVSGILLTGIGNGLLLWAERRVDSGVASLWIATVPMWIQLFNWAAFDRERPKMQAIAGAMLGLIGLGLLVWRHANGAAAEPADMAAMLGSAISWSIGTLVQKRYGNAGKPLMAASIQMASGSAFFFVFLAAGGGFDFAPIAAASLRAVGALLYLAILGSIVSFTAYSWLATVAHPRNVSTYALVNPLIAILLAVLIAGETLSPIVFVSFATIVTGVGCILFARR